MKKIFKFDFKKSIKETPVTYAIIAVNIACFLIFGPLFGEFNPAFLLSASTLSEHPESFLLYAFMHGSVLHIIFNMFAVWIFRGIEEAIGKIGYIALYLGGALLSASVVLWLGNPDNATVGASGAIMAIMGFMAIISFTQKIAVKPMLFLLAINALFSLLPGVSWQGHLGGFIAGLIGGTIFYAHLKVEDVRETKEIQRIIRAEKQQEQTNQS